MGGTATQRKAWNEAMRNAGAILQSSSDQPSSHLVASSSSSAVGSAGIRVSDRRRKNSRRDKARKSSVFGSARGESLLEEREYRVAVHMDILEGVTDQSKVCGDDDDDEYDEFAELDESAGGGTKKKKKRRTAGGGAGSSSSLPNYWRPRSLASILVEEASRPDSMAKQYVNAAVRSTGPYQRTEAYVVNSSEKPLGSQKTDGQGANTTTTVKPYPQRKFCPVTGLFGIYTDPKSGIPYANLSALEQIKERPPPWLAVGSGGSASYWEAVKSLRDDS